MQADFPKRSLLTGGFGSIAADLPLRAICACAMRTAVHLERKAVDHGERAILLAAGKLEFLPYCERGHQKHEVLEADARVCDQFTINLEGLA